MTNDLTPQRMPWEPVPVTETLALLQRDVMYLVSHTAVLVRSNRAELSVMINTRRGQIIPGGECKFTEGVTVEFQDIGMPQINCPAMTVQELMTLIMDTAKNLGLELL